MKITQEQAERLCAYIAAASTDLSFSVELSEVTTDTECAFSPEKVQELIRDFVDSEANI